MANIKLVKELRARTGAGMLDVKKALEATNDDIDAAIDYLREKGIAKAAKKGGRIAAEGLTKVVQDGDTAVVYELNSETDFVAKNEQFLTLLDTVGEYIIKSGATTVEEALAFEINGESLDSVITTGIATIGEKISLRRFKTLTKEEGQVFGKYIHMGGKISVLALFEGNDEETSKQVSMHIAAFNPQYMSVDSVDPAVIQKEKDFLTKEALDEGKPANIVENMVKGRMNKFLEEIVLTEQSFVVDQDKKVKDVLTSSNLKLIEAIRFEVGEGIEKEEVDFAAEVAAQAKV